MKKLLALLLTLLCLPLGGLAEVCRIKRPAQLPEGWEERELLRLTVIDTERSDAMLLQCGGEAMMVDGGEAGYFHRVQAALKEQGVTSLKYLYSTHGDMDHLGGLLKLMDQQEIPCGTFLSPYARNAPGKNGTHQRAVGKVREAGMTYQRIENRDRLTLGGAEVTVIRTMTEGVENDGSAMCQVRFGDSKLLLTADCGNGTMRYFLEHVRPELLQCDVMKAMHHGINGIVPEVLEAAQPDLIFVTNTPYNLQSTTLLQFQHLDALFSGSGTLHMETDGKDWYVWQDANSVD